MSEDKKITELEELATSADDDLLVLEDISEVAELKTKKQTKLNLLKEVWASLANKIEGVVWGDITGTLSSQTDLQTELDKKLETESDPIFTASEASNFITGDKSKLDGIEDNANNYTLESHDNTKHSTNYEPEFTKNTAFNKDFGTAINTVTQGNDSRLSDDRTPLVHDNTKHTENYITDYTVTELDVTTHEGAINHNALLNYDIDEHRKIDDTATGLTDLWSASKINTELGDKADNTELDSYVPYTGATDNVDLGANEIYADKAGIGTTTPTRVLDSYGYTQIGKTGGNQHHTLNLSGNLHFEPVVAPSSAEQLSVTLTASTGGTLIEGTYHYYVLYYTEEGDTSYRQYVDNTITLGEGETAVELSNILISPDPRVIGRRIYRSNAGGGSFNCYRIASIADNTTTTFKDTGFAGDLNDRVYRKMEETGGSMFAWSNTVKNPLFYTDSTRTVIGTGTGRSITTATTYLLIGSNVGGSITTGSNVAVGHNCLSHLTTGTNNTALGMAATYGIGSSSGSNVGIGPNAVRTAVHQVVHRNVGIGHGGLYGITSNDNVGIGYHAGYAVDAIGGVFIGSGAGRQSGHNGIGHYNIAIGMNTGKVLGTGSQNILLGYNIDLATPNSSNQLNIGNVIYGTGLATGSTPSATGKVGIGKVEPTEALDVEGNTKTDKALTPEIKTDTTTPTDLKITTGAEKTLELDSVVWNDMMVSLGQVIRGSSAPDWEDYMGTEVLAFDKGQSNKISFNIQFAHGIKTNSTTEFHIHTAVPDDNAGSVRWSLTVTYADINGTFVAGDPITVTQTIAENSKDKHQLFSIANPFTSNTNISGFALCSLTRLGTDGADDYDNDIYLLGMDSHYQIDTLGSRTITTK